MSDRPGLTAQLLHVGPHRGAHRVAARASISVLVPLLVLWSTGHLELAIYATFGAFTSLYGRTHVRLSRARMQATLAVLLTASVTLGTLVGASSHRSWLAVPVAALVAAAGSLLSDAQDWHPPGPLFLVFSFAACASVPSTLGDVPVAAAVAGASALFALGAGAAGAGWRRWTRSAPPSSGPLHRASYAAVARRHVLRNAGGVLVAGALATTLGIGHPYWAMVSAAVPLAARDLVPQVVRGVQRVVGTLVGLGVAALLFTIDPTGLVLIVVIVALQATAELLVGRNYALALVAITPLALLMVHLVAPVPSSVLMRDRGVETVLGVAVGLVMGWVTRSPAAAGGVSGDRSAPGRAARRPRP
jgi:hypothetical protein